MGQPGRPDFTTRLTADELEELREMILDPADYAVREIFEELDLGRDVDGEPLCSERTLRRYAKEIRDRAYDGSESFSRVPSRSDLIDLSLKQIYRRLQRGAVKISAVSNAINSLVKLKELDIKESAERRAGELHEVKLRELRAAVKDATTGEDGKPKMIDRGKVYDLIDQVMRGGG